jgi:hypothetical protein
MSSQTQQERRLARFALIEKYLDSGLTQDKFCEQQQLAYSTFQFWLKKYRQVNSNRAKEQQSPANTFLPLTFTSPKNDPAPMVIEYPNGVILHINGAIEPQLLIQLIQSHGA